MHCSFYNVLGLLSIAGLKLHLAHHGCVLESSEAQDLQDQRCERWLQRHGELGVPLKPGLQWKAMPESPKPLLRLGSIADAATTTPAAAMSTTATTTTTTATATATATTTTTSTIY